LIARHIYPPKTVIAGLDPAIQDNLMNAEGFMRRLDCRVKPGNDIVGGVLPWP
jgi:hypothetical protein